jgi:hypothetical protein
MWHDCYLISNNINRGDSKNTNRCLLFCNQKQVNFICCKQIKIATLYSLSFIILSTYKISNANGLDEMTIPVDTILYLSLYYSVSDLVHWPNLHIKYQPSTFTISHSELEQFKRRAIIGSQGGVLSTPIFSRVCFYFFSIFVVVNICN